MSYLSFAFSDGKFGGDYCAWITQIH